MLKIIYYSATGNTLKALRLIAEVLSEHLGIPVQWFSYTTPAERAVFPTIDKEDIVVWGSPVYAGRLPNKLTPFVAEKLKGCGNSIVLIATFGNRSFDNALAEMHHIAQNNGFRTIAAAAVVAQHSFSNTLAAGRPDASDLESLASFARTISLDGAPTIPGDPEAPYYRPLKEDLHPANFLKAIPSIDSSRCILCEQCIPLCPMGSLSLVSDKIQASAPCIKCMACVKSCPQDAITISDPDFRSHVKMLETHCLPPKQNLYFT